MPMTPMDPFLVGVAVLCLTVHLLLRRLFRKRPSSLPLPPGPRGLPFLGALPLVGPAPHSGLARLARRYGPIMYLKMGTAGVVVASSPAAARAFLKTVADAQYANRPDVRTAREVTYGRQNMVFADYGAKWKLLRKLSSLHLLGGRALADWAPVRRAEAGHMLRTMRRAARQGRAVVVQEALVCAFANMLGRITLSTRVFDEQGEESNDFKDMIVELLTGTGLFNIGDFVPAIAWMDLQGVQAQMHRVHKKFDAMVTKLLEKHAATAKEREGKPDFVDILMANREGEDGETVSDVNIKAMIFDLFTAGTDTSSIIVEWAMAEMLRNPAILKRAQEETDEVVGRHRRLEESDIPNLPYLQAVCKEAMRKHPSTPLSLPHFSFEACEVGGYYVPANTRLLVNIWAIGRDPGAWEDPLEFRPERFLQGPKIEPLGNDFELIPFGAGRRICAGKLVGMVFVQYMLGTLVHSFDWALPDGEKTVDMEEKFGLALPKAVPLKAMASPRLAASAYE